jgi:hypothetical protein
VAARGACGVFPPRPSRRIHPCPSKARDGRKASRPPGPRGFNPPGSPPPPRPRCSTDTGLRRVRVRATITGRRFPLDRTRRTWLALAPDALPPRRDGKHCRTAASCGGKKGSRIRDVSGKAGEYFLNPTIDPRTASTASRAFRLSSSFGEAKPRPEDPAAPKAICSGRLLRTAALPTGSRCRAPPGPPVCAADAACRRMTIAVGGAAGAPERDALTRAAGSSGLRRCAACRRMTIAGGGGSAP